MFPISNDIVIFGCLSIILYIVFTTQQSDNRFFSRFYKIVPPVVCCYFFPAFFSATGLIDYSDSQLYYIASRLLLPACLFLYCVTIDIRSISQLGYKAIVMFFTATLGIVLGAPLAILLLKFVAPSLLPDDLDNMWRGLSTVAGSWIGGSANQTAMKEVFSVPDSTFALMLIIDVFVQNFGITFLLYGSSRPEKLDNWLKADTSSIKNLIIKLEAFQESVQKKATASDYVKLMGITFFIVALSHIGKELLAPPIAQYISSELLTDPTSIWRFFTSLGSGFFWLVILVTLFGLLGSFTKLRKLEGIGASNFATLFLYILISVLGMKMDLVGMFNGWDSFKYFLPVSFLWLIFHFIILFVVAKLIKAPFFFIAVASQANVGGAASAPVVASAYHSRLAPVGVLLAVLGYAVGTFGAIVCTILMKIVA